MLIGPEIRDRGLIDDALERNYRFCSYDASIWKIITPGGQEVDSFKLEPMGIVEVISREKIRVDPGLCCFAHVKTSLCNEGLLTLNTGIVDPGWNGRVSSFILNFGKNDRLLLAGSIFLRLTFHELSSKDLKPPAPIDDAEYILERRRNIVERFSQTFLNLALIVEKTVDENFRKYRNAALTWLPLVAIFLTVLTFLLNFATLSLVQKWIQPNDAAKAELMRGALDKETNNLSQEYDSLSARIQQLEQALSRPAAPSPPPQSPAPPH
jgi:hypothetical protein